jgi:hypothetical protein
MTSCTSATCLDVIKQLEEQRNSLMLKNAGKKGQKPGLKRRGSDSELFFDNLLSGIL